MSYYSPEDVNPTQSPAGPTRREGIIAATDGRIFLWVGLSGVGGFLAGVGLFVAAAWIWYGPDSPGTTYFAVEVEAPAQAVVDQPFTVQVHASNPHALPLQLSDLDFPDAVFSFLTHESSTPAATLDSPVGGLGTQTYYYEAPVQPGALLQVELKFVPTKAGRGILQFDVCTGDQACTNVTRSILVKTSGVGLTDDQ